MEERGGEEKRGEDMEVLYKGTEESEKKDARHEVRRAQI